MNLWIPQTTRKAIDRVSGTDRHPGLVLDKFCEVPANQEEQKGSLEEVVTASRGAEFPPKLLERRKSHLQSLNASTWSCETASPLTLHLARASVFENAGICLHPLYGFAYLPGSGLKGMARAFAETVWMAGQEDKKSAWTQIESVFGWSPGSDAQKESWKPEGIPAHGKGDESCVGSIVFHDAWPIAWPRLFVDITNNHHAKYYQGTTNEAAPGDWENPVPVYFLAVPPGVEFSFAVSKRRDDCDETLHSLAREWLTGALCHRGAGAKTAAGYGAFCTKEESLRPDDAWKAAIVSHSVAEKTFTLELVTPAFLAGADQKSADCDLRPATLRGLLRWWWRTLHAAHVDVNTLRALESAVWGSTELGSAVRITVTQDAGIRPQLYSKQEHARLSNQQLTSNMGIPNAAGRVTQGLWYQSYGMDEGTSRDRRQRQFLPPGSRWKVTLTARKGKYNESRSIDANVLLDQTVAALALLCRYGGIGSKARKGFGSFKDLADFPVDRYATCAQEFRKACGIESRDVDQPASPALDKALDVVEVQTPWTDSWFALDQLGFSVEAFAKTFKRNESKAALGLPKGIHERARQRLTSPKGDRYAAPVSYHLARGDDDTLIIRAVAFPAKYLPDWETSKEFLTKFMGHLKQDLARRAQNNNQPATPPREPGLNERDRPEPTLTQGMTAQVTLLEEKTKKGKWKGSHETSGYVGHIDIGEGKSEPEDWKPGKKVQVSVFSVTDATKIAIFKWPHEENRPQQERPDQRGPDRGPRRGQGGPGYGGQNRRR